MTSEPTYVDPVLVALSDHLVMVALERAVSRCLPRRVRGYQIEAHERHSAYTRLPIEVDRIDAALANAWTLCGYLAARHDLDVEPDAWAALLDGYARALLMTCEPHETSTLTPHLAPLGVASRWVRPFAAVS